MQDGSKNISLAASVALSKEFIISKMKNQKSTIKLLNKNKEIKEVKII